jgi:hypothetical protein
MGRYRGNILLFHLEMCQGRDAINQAKIVLSMLFINVLSERVLIREKGYVEDMTLKKGLPLVVSKRTTINEGGFYFLYVPMVASKIMSTWRAYYPLGGRGVWIRLGHIANYSPPCNVSG